MECLGIDKASLLGTDTPVGLPSVQSALKMVALGRVEMVVKEGVTLLQVLGKLALHSGSPSPYIQDETQCMKRIVIIK